MFGKSKQPVTTTLSVKGMMCGHCTARVEAALKAVKGVESATADLATDTVCVVADAKVSPAALNKAVTDAGYTVE